MRSWSARRPASRPGHPASEGTSGSTPGDERADGDAGRDPDESDPAGRSPRGPSHPRRSQVVEVARRRGPNVLPVRARHAVESRHASFLRTTVAEGCRRVHAGTPVARAAGGSRFPGEVRSVRTPTPPRIHRCRSHLELEPSHSARRQVGLHRRAGTPGSAHRGVVPRRSLIVSPDPRLRPRPRRVRFGSASRGRLR
jgi:hypothetical protein